MLYFDKEIGNLFKITRKNREIERDSERVREREGKREQVGEKDRDRLTLKLDELL